MSWESCHFHLSAGWGFCPMESTLTANTASDCTKYTCQVGSVITLGVDRGFNFELHIVSNSLGIITTQLQVTAVRELDGVTVECIGASDDFMFTIQVASVGELIAALYIIFSHQSEPSSCSKWSHSSQKAVHKNWSLSS